MNRNAHATHSLPRLRENWLKWLHAVGVRDKILSLQVFKMLLSLAQSANLEVRLEL